MKTLFIEAIRKENFDRARLRELEQLLPDAISIVYSIQYKNLANQVRKELENKKIKILGFSQVLGCSELKTKAEAILLIGNARFHALNLALYSGKEVFIFPENNKISKEEIEKQQKKQKGKYIKFLSASELGIIVSLKPGQQNLEEAIKIKTSLEKKKAYIFLSDSINTGELENFSPGIFVNTACPGLALDNSRIINSRDIKSKK